MTAEDQRLARARCRASWRMSFMVRNQEERRQSATRPPAGPGQDDRRSSSSEFARCPVMSSHIRLVDSHRKYGHFHVNSNAICSHKSERFH